MLGEILGLDLQGLHFVLVLWARSQLALPFAEWGSVRLALPFPLLGGIKAQTLR